MQPSAIVTPKRGRPMFDVFINRHCSGALWPCEIPGSYRGFLDICGQRYLLSIKPSRKEAQPNEDSRRR
jgi:hypothetical protein